MSIIRTSHDKTNPYVMINRKAIDDHRLSWAARGLWTYLMARPDNWQVSVSHLASLYQDKGGGKDAIYSYISELMALGYCKRVPVREKGKFKQFEYIIYESDSIQCYPTDDSEPFRAEPQVVEPRVAKTTLTKTDLLPSNDINKGNVFGRVEGLPQSKEKSKTKFPLKKEQKPILDWLRSQNINSDDDTFIYYIRTYPEQRIRDAVAFMNSETEKGIKIGCTGKFLRRVLDGTIVMQNSNSEQNKATAEGFIRLNEWKHVVITEKYLRHEILGDDIYFNLSKVVFEYALNKLHEKSEIYG